MSRTFLRQDTQIRNSDVYDDTVAAGSTLESTPTHIEADLNGLRSQFKRAIWADSAGNWYDDIQTTNSKKRGIAALNSDLDDIEEKRVLFRHQILTDITVPTSVTATATLTASSNFADGDTVTTGTKTYTFQTTLTNVDGNVLIGGSASDSLDNLIAAINLAAGSGTLYAAATTANGFVSAVAGAGDTLVATALLPGTVGNTIATTDTAANASWSSATLIGGTGDTVTLVVASSQTPSQLAAVGAGTAEGAVVSVLTGDVGAHSLIEVSGVDTISPKNLVIVRHSVTGEPIESTSGKVIYALLQAESGTVDGDTFNDTTKQLQLSFVMENAAGDDLIAATAADIGGKTINYSYVRRVKFDSLPEHAFLTGAFLDESTSANVTLDTAIDNQSGPATQVQDIRWQIADTYVLDFEDAAGTRDLLSIKPNVAGDEIELNIDTLDINNTNRADFLNGARFDSGGTAIDVGDVAGTISSTGALALTSGGAADLSLTAAGEFAFVDTNKSGSTYAGQLKLSDTSQEWSDYETAFGEVSLLRAIYLASTSALHDKYVAVVTTNVNEDVNVTGAGGTPNLDAQLGDYSTKTFVSDVDVYLNGMLLRNGANSGANHDVYPGTTPANGDLMFEFKLKTNDVITMIIY